MKTKKGFTLIELLAVIVVLTVIMVIAIPKIINIIEETDRKAYENSVNLMVEAARLNYQTGNIKGENRSLPIIYEYKENRQINIETYGELIYKGDKPYQGVISITEEGKIKVENLVSKNKKWCAIKSENKAEAKVGKATDLGCIIEDEEEKIKDNKICELEIDKHNENIFYIDSVSDLYQFSKEVNEGNNFSGKIVKLRNNLDMSDTSNTCGLERFEPIGTNGKPFSGTFEGNAKTINNLTINQPDKDYVGLFGYLSGSVKGLNLKNINIEGRNNVGGIEGVSAGGKVNEVTVRGKIKGNSNLGGIAGRGDGGSISNAIINVDVQGTSGNVAGVAGCGNFTKNHTGIIIEGGVLRYNTSQKAHSFHGDGGTVVNSYYSDTLDCGLKQGIEYSSSALGNINGYENAIDTWIGGDDDDSGYYFDYNPKGNLVIKSVKTDPITFNLKGSGTNADPYLIGSYSDWKEATTRADMVGIVFKITEDIDFTGKKFYMLGSYLNRFSGYLLGNGHVLKGIETTGGYYQGMIGYMSSGAIVENLTIDGIKISNAHEYIGLVGYNSGIIRGVNLKNISIEGRNNVGGIEGVSAGGKVNEVTVRGKIKGNSNLGGIAGRGDGGSISNAIINVDVQGTSGNVAGVAGCGRFTKNHTGIIIEGGVLRYNTSQKAHSFHGDGGTVVNCYYSDTLDCGLKQGIGFSSMYVNDLTYYDSLLDNSNNPIIESKYTGDVNGSGYFFDYKNDGKVYVVKSYRYNLGNNEIDGNYTMSHVEGTTDITPPVCKLDYVTAVPNGIRASFSCTDESGVPAITSMFDSTTSLNASTYENIGTNKNGIVNGNTRSIISTWTTNDKVSAPKKGQCYYFRYGGRDSSGNYNTYVTKKCYTAFSN